MFSLFRMLFDWKKLKKDIGDKCEMYDAAVNRHEVASNSLTSLLFDMQKHGPIIENPVEVKETPNVEPIFKLHH
jgi:hypothetical protein